MTQDALELRIQEYLDDRMSDVERRAFEERLATDVALAGRVRDLREISDALRQDAPDLPPGFHTRLRARFEARHTPVRHWFRPLSWETAGLVAAVAVAAVLFVPLVVDQQPGRTDSQILFEPSDKELRKNETREAVEEDLDDAGFAPSPESTPEPTVEPELEQDRRDAPAKSRPAPPAGAKLKKAERNVPLQQAPAEAESRVGRGRSEAGESKDEVRAQSEAYGYRSVAQEGLVLAEGVVEAGEVLEIRNAEQWSRLGLGVERAQGDALGEYDPSWRLVLVGARENPMDCARSTVVAVADAWEIRLAAPTVALAEPVHGCVFRVPQDGRPIRVVGPASPR